MSLLVIAGLLCYATALLLPGLNDSGFLSLGGRGWKLFFLSYVLAVMGVFELLKGSSSSSRGPFIVFVPALLNSMTIALMVCGALGVHGPGMQMLAIASLLGWIIAITVILRRSWDRLQIGSAFWIASVILLAISALR